MNEVGKALTLYIVDLGSSSKRWPLSPSHFISLMLTPLLTFIDVKRMGIQGKMRVIHGQFSQAYEFRVYVFLLMVLSA